MQNKNYALLIRIKLFVDNMQNKNYALLIRIKLFPSQRIAHAKDHVKKSMLNTRHCVKVCIENKGQMCNESV